jgi:YebC/PmpR family DNA-binding regulatory protein
VIDIVLCGMKQGFAAGRDAVLYLRPEIRVKLFQHNDFPGATEAPVAGHSKWAQIKRKKAANDTRRGQAFTKLIREITVAARSGGGDPNFNPRLRLAVDTAKAANMPADNIDRAIRKGTGELEGVQFEEIAYEGYGPGGAALYIQTLTDNSTRTVADVRHVLNKQGGSLGTSGSVAWQFDRLGQIYVDAGRYDEESTLEASLEAGALDVQRDGDVHVITTDLPSFSAVQDTLGKQGITIMEAELAMVPKSTVDVKGDDAQRLVRLMDALDDLDDVQKVYSNANVDDAAFEQAGV